MGKKDTICWRCKNSTGRCCWSKEFKPVPGWNAQQTVIKNYTASGDIVFDSSYVVKMCPMFLKDGLETFDEMANRLGVDKSTMIEKIKILRGNEDEYLL